MTFSKQSRAWIALGILIFAIALTTTVLLLMMARGPAVAQ